MTCTVHNCGMPLTLEFLSEPGVQRLLARCLNGHTRFKNLDKDEPRERGRFANLSRVGGTSDERVCRDCGDQIEATRGPLALYCAACSTSRKNAGKRQRRELPRHHGCPWCIQSQQGPCARHGGASTVERNRARSRQRYWTRKQQNMNAERTLRSFLWPVLLIICASKCLA